MRNAWFLASRGTREYKNKVMVKGSRDTKGLQVMQIVMGDEHTFDCWVSYKQPNGKVIAIKPHLAAWVDMRSRVIMGDVMCKDANSDILKQSLLKMIYSEPGGVPEYLFSNFIFAGCVPDRWMPHVDFFNHFVLLIRDSSFNSFLKFLLLHPAPPSFLHSSIF